MKSVMKIKVKKMHENATIPKYANPGDAGLDLTAVDRVETANYVEYDTGLAFEIPDGYVGLVFPRSSISKMGHSLANSVGVLDSSFRGSVKLRMRKKRDAAWYTIGDRVGQLIIMPYPTIILEESEELNETARGSGGYGSTGS